MRPARIGMLAASHRVGATMDTAPCGPEALTAGLRTDAGVGRRTPGRQIVVNPPSTSRLWPVTYADASEARNTTAPLRSSLSIMRPIGTRLL